jgi:hypothetical protein
LLAEEIRSLTIPDIQQAYKRLVIDNPRQLWVQTQADDVEQAPKAELQLEKPEYRYSF